MHADTLLSACILMFCLSRDLLGTFLGEKGVCFSQPMTAHAGEVKRTAKSSYWMPLRLQKVMETVTAESRGKHSRQSSPQTEREFQFGFQLLSHTEGEAGDEERRRAELLSVGQLDAKHRQLAC